MPEFYTIFARKNSFCPNWGEEQLPSLFPRLLRLWFRGWVWGVRTHPCSSSWSLLCICIKQRRCGYHHHLQPEICTVWNVSLVSKLPHFIATTWCKGHIFGILSTPIDSPIICVKCKETHLTFHSTSSSDPSLLFFLHMPVQTGIGCHPGTQVSNGYPRNGYWNGYPGFPGTPSHHKSTHPDRFFSACPYHFDKKVQLSLTTPRDACEKFARFT